MTEIDKGEKGFVVSGFHALVVFEEDGKTHLVTESMLNEEEREELDEVESCAAILHWLTLLEQRPRLEAIAADFAAEMEKKAQNHGRSRP